MTPAVIVDSTGALALPKVPEHLVVIGGGVIGLELGSVWLRLGAKVTVVEYLDQILPGMDEEVRKESAKIFKKQGFDIKTGTKVTGATVNGGKATLTVEPAKGGEASTIEADAVLVAIGRRPNIDGLGARQGRARAQQAAARSRPTTTSAPRCRRSGRSAMCIPGPMLAHKAEDEGIAAAENIAGQTGIVNHAVIPSVVYTHPEIAGVGAQRRAGQGSRARDQGRQIPVHGQQPRQDQPRHRRLRQGHRRRQERPRARRVDHLQPRRDADRRGLRWRWSSARRREDIAYTCHAHPTHAEALKEAAMAVQGKPIHI